MNLGPILALIRKLEARGDYNIVWAGIAAKDRPKRPLTQMTVGEVKAWQSGIRRKGYASTAAGAYQFISKTLAAAARAEGIPDTAVLDADLQDRLAVHLMRGRGLDDYVAGRKSVEAFCNDLAKEWASLPLVSGPNKGRSFYAGDGLNSALTPVEPFMTAVAAIRWPETAPKERLPLPSPAVGIAAALAALVAGIAAWFGSLEAWMKHLFGG